MVLGRVAMIQVAITGSLSLHEFPSSAKHVPRRSYTDSIKHSFDTEHAGALTHRGQT
jgi:hypothetical protein